jgi:DNA gyrase/topoisomerase IV subunit B
VCHSQAPLLQLLLQVSFANSICTSKGGTHVNYVVDQITK